jgi:hypothetical protein
LSRLVRFTEKRGGTVMCLRLCVLVLALVFLGTVDAMGFFFRSAAPGSGTAATAVRATGTAGNVARAATFGSRVGAISRYCVRTRGTTGCTTKTAADAEAAARSFVREPYRVRRSSQPDLFDVIDVIGNVVGAVEVIPSDSESPAWADARSYESESSRMQTVPNASALRQGLELVVNTNGESVVVWSDGPITVSTGPQSQRVNLAAGERLRFDGRTPIHALPRAPNATTLYSLPAASARSPLTSNGLLQPAEGEVFRYGTPTMCPQIPIGNGMARCQ